MATVIPELLPAPYRVTITNDPDDFADVTATASEINDLDRSAQSAPLGAAHARC